MLSGGGWEGGLNTVIQTCTNPISMDYFTQQAVAPSEFEEVTIESPLLRF